MVRWRLRLMSGAVLLRPCLRRARSLTRQRIRCDMPASRCSREQAPSSWAPRASGERKELNTSAPSIRKPHMCILSLCYDRTAGPFLCALHEHCWVSNAPALFGACTLHEALTVAAASCSLLAESLQCQELWHAALLLQVYLLTSAALLVLSGRSCTGRRRCCACSTTSQTLRRRAEGTLQCT